MHVRPPVGQRRSRLAESQVARLGRPSSLALSLPSQCCFREIRGDSFDSHGHESSLSAPATVARNTQYEALILCVPSVRPSVRPRGRVRLSERIHLLRLAV